MKPEVFTIKKERSALIVVDMQNDFVREGGALEVPDARERIPAVKKLITAFHNIERPVIFTRFIAGPERTLIWGWSPQIAPPTRCCWRGVTRYYADIAAERECISIIDELPVRSVDYIVDKYGYSAFHNTQLEDILKANSVEIVVVCGAAMPVCVNETVCGAFARNFRVVVAEDATASFTPQFREYSLQLFAFKYGRVASVDEILKELKRE